MSTEIVECQNFKVIADFLHTSDLETTIKEIREKTKNWDNIRKYDFLYDTLKIKGIKLNKEFIVNANNIVFNNLYCDTSKLKRNWLKKILIVGDMGSGKTEMINWLVQNVLSLYSQELKIALIFSNSLKYCLDKMVDADIIIIVIDDAIEYQSSQRFQSKENQRLAWKFYKIRHWYKHLTGRTNTFIITIFTGQRYKELDPRFREAHILFFKNVLLTKEENKLLRFLLKEESFGLLEKATILRNFNLPQYGKYYAYYINDRYAGFSEFPEPKFQFEKIDVSLTNDGTAAADLMTLILHIRNEFFKKYGKNIKWLDLCSLVGWRGTDEGLRKKYYRWMNQIPDYSSKMEEIAQDPYYKPKEKKIKNINNEIEKAISKN